MIRHLKQAMLSLFAATILLGTSCASSSDDEEVEDPIMEDIAEDETVDVEPAEGGESLASELDKLALPEIGDTESYVNTPAEEPLPGAADSMVDNAASYKAPMDTASYAAPMELPEIEGEVSEYIVQPGDTLGGISAKVYGTASNWPQLASDNAISQPSLIFPGDVLRYRVNERARTFKTAYEGAEQEVIMVQEGDSLEVIAERLFGRKDYWKPMWILNKDQIPNPHRIYSGQIVKYVDPKKISQALQDKGINSMAH